MTNIFPDFLSISISVSPVIIVLILFSPLLNKHYAAKWKYRIWVFLAVRLVMPFHVIDARLVSDALLKTAGLAAEKNETDRQSEQAPWNGQMTAPILGKSPESNITVTMLDIIALIWLSGSLVFLSVHLASYFHYKRQVVKKGIRIKDNSILCQMASLKRELGIKSEIHVVRFSEAGSPMIMGFLKPVLILPEERYTSEELFFILKHELVHCKRKDVYAKLLFLAVNALHWFNPLIWIMQKEAAVDMELSCDEKVVQGAGYDVRKAYTETLLSTLLENHVKKTGLTTQFYGGAQIMKKRFRNILNKADRKSGAAILIGTAVLTLSLGMLAGCAAADKNAQVIPDQTENEKTENESILADTQADHLPDDSMSVREIPQDGQMYGYLSEFGNASVTIDRQSWVTSESEDWKPEYNEDAGFAIVDAEGEDLVYPLGKDCTFSVLENHHDPAVELDKKEFENYLLEMEYPVLWIIQLEDGQIQDIREQYVP